MDKQKAKQQIQKLVEKYQRVAETDKIKSYNEAQTRNEFIEPLFEFLGWDMRNLTTDNEVTTEENISGGRVDLAFRFNNIPAMFLEAKALKVDLDEWKWAEQAINYSWNKSVTWAVLTDFESIKVFNAEIPPKGVRENLFIEIKCQDYIDRFDQLWLLSKESFEQKLLDKEAQKWGKLTARKQVGEKLFEDLMSWRISLAKDFKKQNILTDEELDEGVQRILDRLIFIRTAEDRKIESNVLLGILRGGKTNLYKQLVKAFRDFDDGFNSKLFAPHYCEEWKASDKIISEVIKGLYETKDGYRYDFFVISADVLGGMYEQYLGYVQGRKSEEKQKSKRKSQGIYYTPKYIVEFIVKETLGEMLKKTKPKEISKIRVLDPACGSGSFLIAAYDKILETLTKQNSQTSLFAKFDILKENIFGVDLDAQAVEIAQLNLLLKVLSQKTKLPTLQHNLRMGNSLISEGDAQYKPFNFETEFKEVSAQGGFDVIIGNPPYVRQENIKQYKSYFEKEFPNVYAGTADLFVYFFEKSMHLLKDGGYFGFIVSNKFIKSGYGMNLRKYIQNNFKIISLIEKFNDKVFEAATVDPCIIIIQKEKPRKNHQILYNKKIKVPQSSLSEKGWSFIDETELNLKRKIESAGKKIKDWECVNIYRGVVTGLNNAYIIDQNTKENLTRKDTNSLEVIKPLLRGQNLKRYQKEFKNEYLIKIKPGINLKKYPAIEEHLKKYEYALSQRWEPKAGKIKWYELRPCVYYDEFEKPKIIYPDISEKGGFYLDNEGYYFNNTIYMIVGNVKKSWVAILNSKLINWYYRQIASGLGDKGIRYFTQFMKEMPIIEKSDSLENLAQQMLDFYKELQATSVNTDKYNSLKREIEKLDHEIDSEVYKLYGLTNEEIKTIEE